jgi:hypothetical protein
MEKNQREQTPYEQEHNKSESRHRRSTGLEGLQTRVNKTSDDLDEKSSTVGRTGRGRTTGLSSKDGLTGSDLDGQVTR